MRSHQRGELTQHGVPGRVPAGVVDHLEEIEIQIQQLVKAAISQRRGERVIEGGAIVQTGQTVVMRLEVEAPNHGLAIADIAEDQYGTLDIPAATAHGRSLELHGTFTAIACHQQRLAGHVHHFAALQDPFQLAGNRLQRTFMA